ncbi:MAG: phosphoribosylamine--glycine ligase [Bdellovibrionaceae bacterium]|nr:phosphoribosylamine--glycine ligase [Bdellovibrio sp.]
MKVLVIGSGGREHALVKSLSESKSIKKVFVCPGNVGMQAQAKIISMNIKDHVQVVQFCLVNKIDFVVIGPEDPLVDGLADSLRAEKIRVFGPSKQAAQLEGSKIFAKKFMLKANVPTADAEVVNSVASTMMAAETHQAPYILKADGLAAGKGVSICKNLDELKSAAQQLFEKKIFGAAGARALLEKNLPGYELSILVLTNGSNFQALPLAQDHKRLKDNDVGPNTGGMGTVAPLKIANSLEQKIIRKIIEPSVAQMKKDKMLFRGVLFVGVMVVDGEPYALEYNTRFGDPETQVLLPLIKNDLGKVFYLLSNGFVEDLQFNNKSAFCIVNAAPGYPEQVQKNVPIQIPANTDEAYILHAGTAKSPDGQLISAGGRVLNIVAIDESFEKAKQKAYALNAQIQFEGRQFRTDLGSYQFQRNET